MEGEAKNMEVREKNARIKVVGVGGGGGNAVERMIDDEFSGVEYIAINTDIQVLNESRANKVLIGPKITQGLGAGANPNVGKKAAEENREEIKKALEGADMIYIAVGMGGGTGTGASPVVAEIAKSLDILTIGIVTLPFKFEGRKRTKQALEGKKEFSKSVDTLITIPNDKILESLDEKEARELKMEDAFKLADSVLSKAAAGVTSLINEKGHVNLDFADIRTVVKVGGSALIGIGEFKGENAAVKAAQEAMTNPLLLHDIRGAKGVIMNFTSSKDLSFFEVTEAATTIEEKVDEDAEILFGHVIAGEDWEDEKVQVTIVATGFPDENTVFEIPTSEQVSPEPVRVVEKDITKNSVPEEQAQEIYITKQAEQNSKVDTKEYNSIKSMEEDLLMDGESALEIPAFLRNR